jgi:hypothetical protein
MVGHTKPPGAPVGDFPLRGYYVWATMGFDGEIPAATLAELAQK